MIHNIGCLHEKNDDELIQEFEKINKNATKLDMFFFDIYKRNVDLLVRLFSNIPKNIKHITLKCSSLCCMKIASLAKLFKSIPDHIESINLRDNGIDCFELEDLFDLKNTLPGVRRVFLSNHEIIGIKYKKDKCEERFKALGNIFPNAKEVVFVKRNGEEDIHDKNDSAVRRYNNAKKLYLKCEVPSLEYQARFLIWSKPWIPKDNLPDHLVLGSDELGAQRFGPSKNI